MIGGVDWGCPTKKPAAANGFDWGLLFGEEHCGRDRESHRHQTSMVHLAVFIGQEDRHWWAGHPGFDDIQVRDLPLRAMSDRVPSLIAASRLCLSRETGSSIHATDS